MQIDKYGNDVGYDKRLCDIKRRYGEDSIVYKKCFELIEKIRLKQLKLSNGGDSFENKGKI